MEDYEELGLWKWLTEALAEVTHLPFEERLRRHGVSFEVIRTVHGDLILFDPPNLLAFQPTNQKSPCVKSD